MEPEGLLPCSQEPATESCHDTSKSYFVKNAYKLNFAILLIEGSIHFLFSASPMSTDLCKANNFPP
jgi:hypothetical protein